MLNRATTGNGVTEGIQRRAAYAEIFETAGRAQLYAFGQVAIDTADAVLADSVYRAVASLPSKERPFSPAQLLELVPNAEYTEAQALVNTVMDDHDAAKRAFDTFIGGRHGQVTTDQIRAALDQRDRESGVDDFNVDDILDEAGGIREDALVRLGKRTAGN